MQFLATGADAALVIGADVALVIEAEAVAVTGGDVIVVAGTDVEVVTAPAAELDMLVVCSEQACPKDVDADVDEAAAPGVGREVCVET